MLVVARNVSIVGETAGLGNGFTIKGGRTGISVSNSGSATITDNHITENRIGVTVTRTSFGLIEDNRIDANGFDDDENPINRGHGIFVGMSSSALINYNTIDSNGDVGVRVAGASNARLSDNDITGNENEGLDVTLNANVRLSDGSGGPNKLEGNGNFGWRCRINASIWPTENQDFGVGGNAGGNTSIESDCVKQGPFD